MNIKMNDATWEELAAARKLLKEALRAVDAILQQRPPLPGTARFDEETVREIRERHHKSGESVTKLAIAYGVNKSTISRAVRFQSHKQT